MGPGGGGWTPPRGGTAHVRGRAGRDALMPALAENVLRTHTLRRRRLPEKPPTPQLRALEEGDKLSSACWSMNVLDHILSRQFRRGKRPRTLQSPQRTGCKPHLGARRAASLLWGGKYSALTCFARTAWSHGRKGSSSALNNDCKLHPLRGGEAAPTGLLAAPGPPGHPRLPGGPGSLVMGRVADTQASGHKWARGAAAGMTSGCRSSRS